MPAQESSSGTMETSEMWRRRFIDRTPRKINYTRLRRRRHKLRSSAMGEGDSRTLVMFRGSKEAADEFCDERAVSRGGDTRRVRVRLPILRQTARPRNLPA